MGIQIITAAVTRAEAELAAAGTLRWLVDAVLAVVESHHAIREHGSPTAPASAESWVLHAADLVSARLAATHEALETATPLAELTWYRAGNQFVQAFHEVAVPTHTRPSSDAPHEAVAPTDEAGEIPDGLFRLTINPEEA